MDRKKAIAKRGARPISKITARVAGYIATVCSIGHDALDQAERDGKLGDDSDPRAIAKLRRAVNRLHEVSGLGKFHDPKDMTFNSLFGIKNERVTGKAGGK